MTLVRQPRLILTRGLSGSGKSTLAAKLVEACGLIRLRSDIERKRLFAVPALSSDPAPVGKGIYSLHAGKRTYQHLVNSARSILAAGYPVIIDATFLKQEQRLPFQQLAERCKVPFHILDMFADTSLLRQRIHRRLDTGLDPSEADSQVLDRQIAIQEPLVESEMPYRIPVSGNDGGIDAALPGLVRQLGQGNGSGPLVP